MTVTAACPAPCGLAYTFDASRYPDPGRCALCSFRAAFEPQLEREIAARFRAEKRAEEAEKARDAYRQIAVEGDDDHPASPEELYAILNDSQKDALLVAAERDAAKAEADAIRRRWMEEMAGANKERDAARKLTTDTIVAYAEERARFAEVVKTLNLVAAHWQEFYPRDIFPDTGDGPVEGGSGPGIVRKVRALLVRAGAIEAEDAAARPEPETGGAKP